MLDAIADYATAAAGLAAAASITGTTVADVILAGVALCVFLLWLWGRK